MPHIVFLLDSTTLGVHVAYFLTTICYNDIIRRVT